jgi:undecaprenyl-diphosphatase
LLGVVGLLFLVAEKFAKHRRRLDQMMLMDALLIGMSQALAIMPGVSRSGITIICALFLGFNRRSSAHFSFLLSTPIIAGAGLHHIPKWLKSPPEDLSLLAATLGFIAALISSYLAIKFLMSFLQRHTFIPFAVYRIALAALILGLAFSGR